MLFDYILFLFYQDDLKTKPVCSQTTASSRSAAAEVPDAATVPTASIKVASCECFHL